MAAQPTLSRQALINDSIEALKDAGLWDKIGWLSVMAAHDEQAARLNWKNPNQSLTAVNLPQFIRDYAFKCDGQSSYFSTGIAINAFANYSRDAAAMGVFVPDNTGAFTGLDMGTSAAYIASLNTASIVARANHTGTQGSAQSISATTAFGWSYWARQSSSEFQMGRNSDAPTTKAIASATLDTSVVQIGKAGSTGYSSKPLSVALIGNFSASEMQSFYTLFIRPYLTALSVPVP